MNTDANTPSSTSTSEPASVTSVEEDLLSGFDRSLDEGVVVGAGEWTKKSLIQSMSRWRKNFPKGGRATKVKRGAKFALQSGIIGSKDLAHPLSRTGKLFGCLYNDIRRKALFYISDLVPVFDVHCLAAVLFIYFAALAPCITFGGLLSENTNGQIGISEMIIVTGISGILFSLFSGQPLLVVGATGPMLIMESKIYELANMMELEFLPWRACIGIWTVIICLAFVAFDLCGLIRQVTCFTEEIFAALVSIIFIQKAISFIVQTFIDHPVGEHVPPKHCLHIDHVLNRTVLLDNATFYLVKENYSTAANPDQRHPCYSLMTTILIVLTFVFALYIRKVRSSMYFTVKIRRIISDFGVILSVFAVVLIDNTLSDNFTKKLSIKQDLFVRKWFVNPFGESKAMGIGYVFLAVIPAFLISIILFIETGITGVMLDKKEHKFKKGFGYHLDLLVVSILVGAGSLLRLPWICTSPVNSLSNFHTLTVLSSDHAPGTHPYIVEVKEQRFTNIIIHVLIGSSLLLAPMLERIPAAVLYGVFLYVGFTSLSRMEFIHRMQLLLIPYKLQPDTRLVRKVRTLKIHLFTLIQLCCVVLLAVIKETKLAAIFPFLILCLVPLRKCLRVFFSEEELENLDNTEDEDELGVSEEVENGRVSVPA
ncbi:anion exchange protein 3-like isoform X1 [Rhopilema esculentum]|uniref:anion exchange protein 3-like isoform X1 n=2 Tax=Rhopilema esculentum TaxID=499914 RepID=UPI0031E349ED